MPRIPTYACDLPDGRRIRFSLKKRPNSDCYFVCFRDADNRRRELTTGERAKHAAEDVAPEKIRKDYSAKKQDQLSWDDAVDMMVRHMRAQNLRPGTIQQYELAVNVLRKVFPMSYGPANITSAMAEQFKIERMETKKRDRQEKSNGCKRVKPVTVEGNIKNLSIVFGHWFRDTLKIVDGNPFADVKPPKYDKTPPRIVQPDEKKGLTEWLENRWHWRLPLLFLDVKATIGCRIGELCQAGSDSLQGGKIYFLSETTKGRRQRACKLPTALYQELKAIAGPTYVFEAFSDQLRSIYNQRGEQAHAKSIRDFTPARLKRWIQDEVKLYFATTGKKRFKLHNLRGTAMTRAREAGISVDDAAVAFGCNPITMKQYYLSPDEEAIADSVFDRLATAN